MKQHSCWLAVIYFLFSTIPCTTIQAQNPLATYAATWNNISYKKANTAAKAGYLSNEERQVIYILNLARMNPPLFASTVVTKFPKLIGEPGLGHHPEFISLMDTLKKLKPLPLLSPDSLCWVSANCHAVSSGESGFVGHNRITNNCGELMHYAGECCHYGYNDPLSIVLSLLVDEGVPSLGHRHILLSRQFSKLGVAFAPHATYGVNTVLDFY